MWDENTLKRCMEENLELVFGQAVVLLDLDTVNTHAGRPDVVLLNASRQLIIVEWESVLTLANIGHALLDQAWHYAKHYYFETLPRDLPELHRRYRDYRFPGQPIPDLHDAIGLGRDSDLWDRARPCIVIVGAWDVTKPAYEKAAHLIGNTYANEKRKMPCEVWVYDVHGSLNSDGNEIITGCDRTRVFAADGEAMSFPLGGGLNISNQHTSARLTSEFAEVARLMERHVSEDLKPFFEEFHSKVKWQKTLLKWSPWGAEKEICFEFSRIDDKNPIKGPHCQLCIHGRKELGYSLRARLEGQRFDLAKQLGCSVDDLKSQGYTYPIKQHRVDDSNPEAIAKVFGRFCSVVYAQVNPVLRKALDLK
ncbi:MAG: hypothetical protein NTU88_00670 [Armatimonadetes bacterium]|nr:hypothetical protein [Armatimonadota bacterium]